MLAGLKGMSQGYIVTEDKPFEIGRDKDSSILQPFSRLTAYGGLSDLEKEYLYWVNRMRSNPRQFYREYVDPFIKQFPEAASEESRSLADDMKDLKQLPMVLPASTINLAAASHASFLAAAGRISHMGKGGMDFAARMKEIGVENCGGEVIFDGKDDVLIGLILLLIDHRVPGQGHRKALLNPEFTRTGIAIRFTKENRTVLVQDFSCK
jgi:hypothetical protein